MAKLDSCVTARPQLTSASPSTGYSELGSGYSTTLSIALVSSLGCRAGDVAHSRHYKGGKVVQPSISSLKSCRASKGTVTSDSRRWTWVEELMMVLGDFGGGYVQGGWGVVGLIDWCEVGF